MRSILCGSYDSYGTINCYTQRFFPKKEKIPPTTDNGHPERAFFQKFETFGLGQTNWAEIL